MKYREFTERKIAIANEALFSSHLKIKVRYDITAFFHKTAKWEKCAMTMQGIRAQHDQSFVPELSDQVDFFVVCVVFGHKHTDRTKREEEKRLLYYDVPLTSTSFVKYVQ